MKFLGRLSLLVAAGAAFGLGPLTGRLGIPLAALAMVSLGVLLALAASQAPSLLAAAGGALGAFSHGALLAVGVPALAGAALVALCFAERTVRVRGVKAKLAHLGLALAAGAGAGALAYSYSGSPLLVRGVVVILCAVVIALPLLIAADHPLPYSLETIAENVDEPTASSLVAAAELYRHVDDSLLDRATAKTMRATWRSLDRLARARARIEHSDLRRVRQGLDHAVPSAALAVRVKLEQRIVEHVNVLTRAYTAVDTASAAEASLDDGTLESTTRAGESLEQISAALVS